jgi:purine nucleosidase
MTAQDEGDLTVTLDATPLRQARVIVNTDAKNEADDQYAIVHALLTPSFELHGIIPAHFVGIVPRENLPWGAALDERGGTDSQAQSRAEVDTLLDLMGLAGTVVVADGAPRALPDPHTPVPSPGAELIIRDALRDDRRPLYIAFYGPLTDMASALLLEPRLAERHVVVVWIGGGPWPEGGAEFNLSNDIHAANVVFRSPVEVWQIPSPVYKLMAVSYAELRAKVAPHGALGRYLVEQLVAWNARWVPQPIEYRSLGDSPAVGVIMYPDCGRWELRPAPEFNDDMTYRHMGRNRPIRVYDSVDARFILEDFFAKLAAFAQTEQ